MSDNDIPPSLIRLQYRRATAICKRNALIGHLNPDKAKSYAQVATSVEQPAVQQKSCGLKPEKSRPFRLAVRLSECEREIVVRRAQKACLTLSEYFRASILGPEYVLNNDPVKRELLKNISRELGRQGNNLNQIAKQLNAGMATPVHGDSMLAILARSLLTVHRSVREALAEGQTET